MRTIYLKIFSILFILSTTFLSSMEAYGYTDGNGVPLDHKLINKLNIKKGVFIEAGAYDGKYQSNTYLLEKNFEWTGILIEPSKDAFQKSCNNRPHSKCFHCALGSFEEDNTYVWGDFDSGMSSSVGGKRLQKKPNVRVLMRSLQSILDELNIQHVNFFSLDTEGYEYNILQGIDFKKTTFDYLLIEIYTWDYERILAFLSERGYDLIENFSFYNKINSPNWDGTHNDYLFKKREQ